METDKVKAFNLNVAGYIIKPIDFNNFIETIVKIYKYWAVNELPLQ